MLTAFERALEKYSFTITSSLTADPAAGAEIANQVVPAGEFWHLIGANVTLVTSATVANRVVSLLVDDGAVTVARFPSPAQAASLTWSHTWSAGAVGLAAAAGTDVMNSLGQALILPPGYRIRTATTALQAGDNFGAMNLWVAKYR